MHMGKMKNEDKPMYIKDDERDREVMKVRRSFSQDEYSK